MNRLALLLLPAAVLTLAGCSSAPPVPVRAAPRWHVSWADPWRLTVDTTTGASELAAINGVRHAFDPPPGFGPAPAGRYAGSLWQGNGTTWAVYDTQTGAGFWRGIDPPAWHPLP